MIIHHLLFIILMIHKKLPNLWININLMTNSNLRTTINLRTNINSTTRTCLSSSQPTQ